MDDRPAVSVTALRARARDGKAALLDAFRDARPTISAAQTLLRALARHVDGILAELWAQAGLPKSA